MQPFACEKNFKLRLFIFVVQVKRHKFTFATEEELSEFLTPVTPHPRVIPEHKKKQFIGELVEEFKKVHPKEIGPDGQEEENVDNSRYLTVVLQKKIETSLTKNGL